MSYSTSNNYLASNATNSSHGIPPTSTFASILNRTQQNLNLINSKYAPAPSSNRLPGPNIISSQQNNTSRTSFPPPMPINVPMSFEDEGHRSEEGNSRLYPNPPPKLNNSRSQNTSQNNPQTSQTSQNYSNSQSYQPSQGYQTSHKNMITIDEIQWQSLLQRLTQLERIQETTNHQQEIHSKTIQSIDKSIDSLQIEQKDVQRNLVTFQSRINLTQSMTENLLTEEEKRKTNNYQLNAWIKDHEDWRMEMNQLSQSLKKELISLQHEKNDLRDQSNQYVSRYELEAMRDKIHLLAQQSLSIALSVHTENWDQKIKTLERELALIKASQTMAVQRELDSLTSDTLNDRESPLGHALTAEVIAKVLQSPAPSELLVKGAVASEILSLESKLEEKLDSRFQSLLDHKLQSQEQELTSYLHKQMLTLCSDALIYATPMSSSTTTTTSFTTTNNNNNTMNNEEQQLQKEFESRIAAGKSKIDQLERQLHEGLSKLTSELQSYKESYTLDERQHTLTLYKLENNLENNVKIHDTHMNEMKNKQLDVEEKIKDIELKWKDILDKTKQESLETLHQTTNDWFNERLQLERRLLMVERVGQDCLEVQRHTNEKLQQTILNHPIIQTTQTQIEQLLPMQNNVMKLTNDLQDLQTKFVTFSSSSVSLSDMLIVRDKLQQHDLFIHEKCPTYFESTKKLLDLTTTETNKIANLENIVQYLTKEMQILRPKVDDNDVKVIQILTAVKGVQEDNRISKNKYDSWVKDVQQIKDLSGSLANKSLTMEAEHKSMKQQVKFVEEQLQAVLSRPISIVNVTQSTPQVTASVPMTVTSTPVNSIPQNEPLPVPSEPIHEPIQAFEEEEEEEEEEDEIEGTATIVDSEDKSFLSTTDISEAFGPTDGVLLASLPMDKAKAEQTSRSISGINSNKYNESIAPSLASLSMLSASNIAPITSSISQFEPMSPSPVKENTSSSSQSYGGGRGEEEAGRRTNIDSTASFLTNSFDETEEDGAITPVIASPDAKALPPMKNNYNNNFNNNYNKNIYLPEAENEFEDEDDDEFAMVSNDRKPSQSNNQSRSLPPFSPTPVNTQNKSLYEEESPSSTRGKVTVPPLSLGILPSDRPELTSAPPSKTSTNQAMDQLSEFGDDDEDDDHSTGKMHNKSVENSWDEESSNSFLNTTIGSSANQIKAQPLTSLSTNNNNNKNPPANKARDEEFESDSDSEDENEDDENDDEFDFDVNEVLSAPPLTSKQTVSDPIKPTSSTTNNTFNNTSNNNSTNNKPLPTTMVSSFDESSTWDESSTDDISVNNNHNTNNITNNIANNSYNNNSYNNNIIPTRENQSNPPLQQSQQTSLIHEEEDSSMLDQSLQDHLLGNKISSKDTSTKDISPKTIEEPIVTSTAPTPSTSNTQLSMRERLRARQEALRQQRTGGSTVTSSAEPSPTPVKATNNIQSDVMEFETVDSSAED